MLPRHAAVEFVSYLMRSEPPLERGLAAFIVATVTRSHAHRFLIGSYLGVGVLCSFAAGRATDCARGQRWRPVCVVFDTAWLAVLGGGRAARRHDAAHGGVGDLGLQTDRAGGQAARSVDGSQGDPRRDGNPVGCDLWRGVRRKGWLGARHHGFRGRPVSRKGTD